MRNEQTLLSICIPTNGVAAWVMPVLDSIFSQGVDPSLYEVVLTDNGGDEEFCREVNEYAKRYDNFKYVTTNSFEFLNEIDAYKNASGKFIKFINHRTKLKVGALQYFIDFVQANEKDKPSVYFANGVLRTKNKIGEYRLFDDYVRNLSYWSSWSTGMAFWKEDFDRMKDFDHFNVLFPHTDILFFVKDKSGYIIDNTVLLDEIPVGKTPKGRYNLFNAFAVEYPAIIYDLYREGSITIDTFLAIKRNNLRFVKGLYFDYIFLKSKCSYDLTGVKKSLSVLYSVSSVKRSMFAILFVKSFKKMFSIFRGKK